MVQELIVAGSPGSPYSRKLLASLRYKRIPYRLQWVPPGGSPTLPAPRVPLLPVLYFPRAEGLAPMIDTTPILRELDRLWPDRPLVPAHPAIAFINALVEDFADEWVTKAMFHYRWTGSADIEKSARVLPNWFGPPMSDAELAEKGEAFATRQIDRLSYVGSNPVTAGTIEESFARLAAWLEIHFTSRQFLFGEAPTSADMAIFGQFSQLVLFDPSPRVLIEREFPRIVAWTMASEDLSGVEGNLADEPADLRTRLAGLLGEIGRTYVPLLLANDRALDRQADTVELEIDGRPWIQPPFPYQAKCLADLRKQYAMLSQEHREIAADMLEGTACDALL